MDVDDPIVATKKRLQDALKSKIPVQEVRLGGIGRTQTDIPVWMLGVKPLGTIAWIGTIDDMGDAPFIHEPGREEGARSHENACVEVGGRLPKILGDRDEHCF